MKGPLLNRFNEQDEADLGLDGILDQEDGTITE